MVTINEKNTTITPQELFSLYRRLNEGFFTGKPDMPANVISGDALLQELAERLLTVIAMILLRHNMHSMLKCDPKTYSELISNLETAVCSYYYDRVDKHVVFIRQSKQTHKDTTMFEFDIDGPDKISNLCIPVGTTARVVYMTYIPCKTEYKDTNYTKYILNDIVPTSLQEFKDKGVDIVNVIYQIHGQTPHCIRILPSNMKNLIMSNEINTTVTFMSVDDGMKQLKDLEFEFGSGNDGNFVQSCIPEIADACDKIYGDAFNPDKINIWQ